jgi:polygalacturonase
MIKLNRAVKHTEFYHRNTFVAYSKNITMTNLDMSAISNSQWTTVNTDGFDSWNSQDITIANWTVTSGDVSGSASVMNSRTDSFARRIVSP